MLEQQRPNSAGTDFSIGDDSDVDSRSKEVSQYNLSYDGEEESPSEEGDNPYHLTQETKNKIKAKIEVDEIRCLKDDILKALKIYREGRKQRGKQLSVRRVADIKRIHVIARSYRNYQTREEYLQALTKAIEVIRGGKLIFNRNKSTLKDALNQILLSYSDPSSFAKKRLYVEMCHYTKIQLSLDSVAKERLPRSGLEEISRHAPSRMAVSAAPSEEANVKDGSQTYTENERLKARLAELEEENLALRNRLQVSRSGGSGGDSKHSRGKTPPSIPEGRSDSPTHSYEDGSSPRKAGSLKKMPPAGVFGMSINDDAAMEVIVPDGNGKKEIPPSGRSSLDDDRKRNKKLGKK